MLRLFNPTQILKMDNRTVENIAAEDKQTRDRRLALKDQKAAIEEAKSLCASLAMRSELRGHDDADEEESEDEAGPQRRFSQQQFAAQQYRAPPSRDPRYEEPHDSPPAAARRPAQEQRQSYRPEPQEQRQSYRQEPPEQSYRHEAVSPASSRLSRGDSTRVSNEWAQNYYTTEPAQTPQAPAAPTSAPPPPPRPPKPADTEEEPRGSREGKRESARNRVMGAFAGR